MLIISFCGCPVAHANVTSGDAIETVTEPTTIETEPTATPKPTETPAKEDDDIKNLTIKQLVKIFALGLCSGLGLVTILYILGTAIGSFFGIIRIGTEER